MGILREWLRSREAERDLEVRLEAMTQTANEYRRERDDAWAEQNRLRDRANALAEQAKLFENGVNNLSSLNLKLQNEKALLGEMLGDAKERAQRDAGLVERLVTVERHNATYQATTQWAIAHINAIAIERGSLIDRLDHRQGLHPVPQFQLETPDVTMAPPPGPIGATPNIMGNPIPEGQTAGDVINRLRAKRDAEQAQRPVDPADLLKQAGDLFEEGPADDAPQPPTTDPFSDLELP